MKADKKLISFDKANYEVEISKLSGRLKFLQAVLDAYHGLQLGSLIWSEYLKMIKDPDTFVREKLTKDFTPKIEGLEFDMDQIKQLVKMPDLTSVYARIDLLFKSQYYTQFINNNSMYYDIVNGRVVLSGLDDIKEKFSFYVNDINDGKRLAMVEALLKQYKKMYESNLWNENVFLQGDFSLFINVQERELVLNSIMISPPEHTGFPTGFRKKLVQ